MSQVSTFRRLVIVRLLQGFISVGALAIVSGAVLSAYPPIFPWLLAVMGRKPMCTSMEVLQGAGTRYRLQEETERIQAGTRLLETDPAGYELWETPEGSYWVPSGSGGSLPVLVAQQAVDQYGTQDGDLTGGIVLDCGAHIGLYVKKALRSGAKLVVAIEPAPANLECLRRNLRREVAAGRVIVVAKGVWDQEDNLLLYEDPRNSAADSFVMQGQGMVASREIPLTPIDTLVEELNLERVAAIKMDIKGASIRALRGALHTLSRDKPHLAVATEEEADDIREITTLVQRWNLGYRARCGSCSLDEDLRVDPEVLFFR